MPPDALNSKKRLGNRKATSASRRRKQCGTGPLKENPPLSARKTPAKRRKTVEAADDNGPELAPIVSAAHSAVTLDLPADEEPAAKECAQENQRNSQERPDMAKIIINDDEQIRIQPDARKHVKQTPSDLTTARSKRRGPTSLADSASGLGALKPRNVGTESDPRTVADVPSNDDDELELDGSVPDATIPQSVKETQESATEEGHSGNGRPGGNATQNVGRYRESRVQEDMGKSAAGVGRAASRRKIKTRGKPKITHHQTSDNEDGKDGDSSDEEYENDGSDTEADMQTARKINCEKRKKTNQLRPRRKNSDIDATDRVESEHENGEVDPEINGADGQEDDETKNVGETMTQETSGISEYELQRLERIRKNQAFMASLGLGRAMSTPSAIAAPQTGGSAAKKKKRSRPVSTVKERTPALAVRRSSRNRGGYAVDYSEDKKAVIASKAAEPESEPEPQEIDFDDSTVLKYLCYRDDKDSSGAGAVEESCATGDDPSESVNEHSTLMGLQSVERDRPLSASGLSTIYTMHFSGGGDGLSRTPPLLAAGGKGGVVAVFSTRSQTETRGVSNMPANDEDEEVRTLLNFKAHKGWVSAVRFLDSTTATVDRSDRGSGGGGVGSGMDACRLLSSANDSVVKLWDISKQHRGVPRLLCTSDDLHPMRKGIFSMDTFGAKVATGSKDTTVAVASLTPAGVVLDRVLGVAGGSEAFHEKVIKGVDLRDEHTVASCGDDANVRVCDLRKSSRGSCGVSYRLDGVHNGPCHTVRWHPAYDHLLLTAGLDSTVKLHDLRKPGVPVHVFRGHCPYAIARPKSIHRPEFVSSASANDARHRFSVVTCGEKSDKLSMYDAETGATISRGLLGAQASALAVGGRWRTSAGTGIIAAAIPGGEVYLLGPVWGRG